MGFRRRLQKPHFATVDPVVAGSSPVRLASGNERKALQTQGLREGSDAEPKASIPTLPDDSAAFPLHNSLHNPGGDELVRLVTARPHLSENVFGCIMTMVPGFRGYRGCRMSAAHDRIAQRVPLTDANVRAGWAELLPATAVTPMDCAH